MIDCSVEMGKYYDADVRLGEKTRGKMRDHRKANQKRLKAGLSKNENPEPLYFVKQGSYAMHTMVQHPENDFDIDDGAVFDRQELKDNDGREMSALEVRQMVCDALQDNSFKKQPEIKEKCVRVHYNEGHHIDVPVYRRNADEASNVWLEFGGVEWETSDPTGITQWFNDAVVERSPDKSNGRQMRRIVTLMKKFSKSRKHWRLPSGLILSVLVDERYQGIKGRDDEAFYDVISAVLSRLRGDLRVSNPIDGAEELSNGLSDSKMTELRDRLEWAANELRAVKEEKRTKNEALKKWDKVFNSDSFGQFVEEDKKAGNQEAGLVGAVKAVQNHAPRSFGQCE